MHFKVRYKEFASNDVPISAIDISSNQKVDTTKKTPESKLWIFD